MIKDLEIVCEDVNIDAISGGKIAHVLRLDMIGIDEQFIRDLEPMDIVQNQECAWLLEAINEVMDEGFIMKWLIDKGSM